jgi:hypothetical protein
MHDEAIPLGVIVGALALAGLIYLQWIKLQPASAVSPLSQGAPAGAPVLPLGQFAAQPGGAWLLLKPGQ